MYATAKGASLKSQKIKKHYVSFILFPHFRMTLHLRVHMLSFGKYCRRIRRSISRSWKSR